MAAHPFAEVQAQAGGNPDLRLYQGQGGAVVRLYTDNPALVFRLVTDPGSAVDRQLFDYHQSVPLQPGPVPALLAAIRQAHAQAAGPGPTGEPT
jgi:hypothetical protein